MNERKSTLRKLENENRTVFGDGVISMRSCLCGVLFSEQWDGGSDGAQISRTSHHITLTKKTHSVGR